MRRREFIFLLGSAAACSAVNAREADQKLRIGQVAATSGEHLLAALELRLRDIGYVDGNNIVLINRIVPPKDMEDAIRSLVPGIDLLVAWSTVGGVAAKRVGAKIPTVFLAVGAPVSIGLVESLAHPGGTMTGVTFEAATETYGKRLQILKEILPSLRRVGVLRASRDANVAFAMQSIEVAARELELTLSPLDISSADDLGFAFATAKDRKVEALLVIAGALTYGLSDQIARLAIEYGLPSCHAFKETVAGGGLASLGPDLVAIARQGALYIDKIARGANPGELPVEQPARYEMHINLKTAKALGLTIPSALLARADEVIE